MGACKVSFSIVALRAGDQVSSVDAVYWAGGFWAWTPRSSLEMVGAV